MQHQRQELVIGRKSQEILQRSTVAVIGIGALGTAASALLARAGIRLILIDRDMVNITNLGSHSLFTERDVGKSKAIQAKKYLEGINKNITAYCIDLDCKNINKIKCNLILDCTDNLQTRFLLNEYAIKNKIPFIYSAVIRDKGSLFNILPGKACLRCVLTEAENLETCDTAGVLNTAVNLVATLSVSEAIKILTGKRYEKCMLYIDTQKNTVTKIEVKKKRECPVCRKHYSYLSGEKIEDMIRFCGSGYYQIKCRNNLGLLKDRLSRLSKVEDLGYCLNFNNMHIFEDRVLIQAKSEAEARSLFARFIG